MKGNKIQKALANRKAALDELKGSSQPDGSLYVQGIGTFHIPGSLASRKFYAALAKNRRKKRIAPQGAGSPSRSARKQGTKSGPNGERIAAIRGRTRGAAVAARKAAGFDGGYRGDTRD